MLKLTPRRRPYSGLGASALALSLALCCVLSLGAASAASAASVTYSFAAELGTGSGINPDFDFATVSGTFTFDDEDKVNTGFHLGYRATAWELSVTGGNDPVSFVSSGELDDRMTIVLDRTTDRIDVAFVEDLTGVVGGRFGVRHSLLVRFDSGIDLVNATNWSDVPASQYEPGGLGFVGGTLQFSGGQIPHSVTSASLLLVPEPGTATMLFVGLALASAQGRCRGGRH